MAEKSLHEGGHEETERTRREMVHLLRSILEEVTIQAQGRTPHLGPEAQAAVRLFERIDASIRLTACERPRR